MENYTLMFLEYIEPRIQYYSKVMWVRGLSHEDVAQELRYHLWKKMHKYNPYLSSPHTWANMVIKNKIFDLTNPRRYKRDMLDCDGRVDANFAFNTLPILQERINEKNFWDEENYRGEYYY